MHLPLQVPFSLLLLADLTSCTRAGSAPADEQSPGSPEHVNDSHTSPRDAAVTASGQMLSTDITFDSTAGLSSPLARVGAARLRQYEWLDSLSVADSGDILSCSDTIVRRWDATTGLATWQARTPGEPTVCAIAPDGSTVAYGHGRTLTKLVIHRLGGTDLIRNVSHARALAFSADGSKLLVLSSRLELWDAVNGARIAFAPIVALTASFETGGSIVAVARDEVLRWSGLPEEAPVSVAKLPARARAAHLNRNATMAVWATDGQLGYVEIATAQSTPIALPFDVVKDGLPALDISPNGEWLVIARKQSACVWDRAKKAPRWELPRDTKLVGAVASSADGSRAYLAHGGDILILDVATGVLQPRVAPPSFQAFTPTNEAVVKTASGLLALDLHTGTTKSVAAVPREEPPADMPSWADDFALGVDGSATSWRDDDTAECKPFRVATHGGVWTAKPPSKCVSAGVFGPWVPAAGLLGFVGVDELTVFDIATKAVTYSVTRYGREVVAFASSPKSDSIVAVLRNGEESTTGDIFGSFVVEMWTPTAEAPIKLTTAMPTRMGIGDLAYTPDGRAILIGWKDGTVELSSSSGGGRTLTTHDGAIQSIQCSSDGLFWAIEDRDAVTTFWRAQQP